MSPNVITRHRPRSDPAARPRAGAARRSRAGGARRSGCRRRRGRRRETRRTRSPCPALIRALTTCIVEAGSTLWSSSPTVSRSLPRSLWALVTFELAAYSGPTGQPIHGLVPPDLVHAVVVAAAVGDGRLVEVAVEEQRPERVLAARRAAVDAHPGQVQRRVLAPPPPSSRGCGRGSRRRPGSSSRRRGTPSSASSSPCRRSGPR